MKVVLDMVINHCSWQHTWFKQSIDKVDPYTDFFIWRDPKGYDQSGIPIEPNNWVSVMGQKISIWTWNDKRRQFYLHQFDQSQPDFNLRNPKVMEMIKDIFRFWLDKGVDGFRLDAAKQFGEDESFKDEPVENGMNNHIYTYDQDYSYEVVHQIRELIENEYVSKDGHDRILTPEVLSAIEPTVRWYGNSTYRCAHFPQNTFLVQAQQYQKLTVPEFLWRIDAWLQNVPKDQFYSWTVENHDDGRIAPRNPKEFIDMFNSMMMVLPNIAVVYYGQEIGMKNANLKPDVCAFGTCSQEPCRTPMQWDASRNAGFSTSRKLWLPINTDSKRINVETEKKIWNSHYNIFKDMTELRKHPTFKDGAAATLGISDNVFAITRTHPNYETFVAIFNVGNNTEIINIREKIDNVSSLTVEIATANSEHTIRDHLDAEKFQMRPRSGVVLKIN